MKEIWKRKETLEQFIRIQRPRTGERYRWSQFVLPVDLEGRLYLFNMFTKQCFEYDGEYQKDALFSTEDIVGNPAVQQLMEGYFLVPESRDECAYYEGILKVMRALSMKKKFGTYTILPTTACNARCVYCYEEGMKQVGMTAETVSKTIDFILSSYDRDRKICLNWFGGEPLLGEKTIDQICGALAENGVGYFSTITTNGSLLNEEIVEKMADLWKLNHIQVSMDGEEKDYIRRKNYRQYHNDYWNVLKGINLLAEKNIRTIIRCNTDFENLGGMERFINDLSCAVTNKRPVSVYLTPLYDMQASEYSSEIWKKSLAFQEWIVSEGFSYGDVTRLHTLKTAYCMADNPFSCVVISPDGLLYNCEHCRPGTETGSVFDGIQNKAYLDSFAFPESVREQCRNCPFLPECTPFSRCPIILRDCYEVKKVQILYDLKHDIRIYRQKNEENSRQETMQNC